MAVSPDDLTFKARFETVAHERERVKGVILAHEPMLTHRDQWSVPVADGGGKFSCLAGDWRGNDLRMFVSHLVEACGL